MIRKEIDQKYLTQATQLEDEFFNIVPDGKGQKRVLEIGKSEDEFNQRHGDIWHNHEIELIAEGFMEAPIPPEPPKPVRDLATEIDELRARIVKLEG